MMNFLYTGAAERVAQKAAHMLDIDPHGWTLTLVSVMVVFGVLIILFWAYSLVGMFFTKKFPHPFKSSKKGVSEDEAAAIAVAIDLYTGGCDEDEAAAIAVALDDYVSNSGIHDIESGIITIKKR